MRSFVQYGLLLVAVAGGVFAATFLAQNTRSPQPHTASSAPEANAPIKGPLLEIPEKVAVWDESDPGYAMEIERGGLGYYDFWVQNPNQLPVSIALQSRSCVCTDVQIGVVPVSDAKLWNQRQHKYGNPEPGPDLSRVNWTTLSPRDKDALAPSATIPAADPATGPQIAIIRLNWNSKEVKPIRMVADVKYWIGDTIDSTKFEVATVIVPPVMLSSVSVLVGDLGINDRSEKTVYAWSATRDAFEITATELSKDPCIEVGPPRKLTAAEMGEATRKLREAQLVGNTRMKAAYAIPIVVYERRNNAQLDLGPMTRRIEVRSNVAPDVYPIGLQGLVRGNVMVGDRGPDQDRINLGTFRADRPCEKTVIVTTTQSDLELRKKSHKPDYLEVKLEEGPSRPGFKQWKLRVEIDANKVSGFLPSDSAVYLETVTKPPRAIRIPVFGNGSAR